MVRKDRFERTGLLQSGALTAALALGLVLICGPPTMAQLKGFQAAQPSFGEDDMEIGDPDAATFCMNDPCPGQTCDEVNNRCVGSVTLQPLMGQPLNALNKKETERFTLGKTAFERTFLPEEGLGPTFNQDSCASCHNTPTGGSGTITVTRFGYIDTNTFPFTFDPLAELGGSLLQAQAIAPDCGEVIPVPPTNVAANRLTNSLLGFGFVENIPDSAIAANVLIHPPVSGRVHVVPVLEDPPAMKAGRFGWKAQLATVLSFAGDASLNEMGITNRIVSQETAANGDQDKLAACDLVADPEDKKDAGKKEFVDRVTDFQRFLSPPPQTPRSGMTGEVVFNAIGCANCHVRSFTTDNSAPDKPLRNQEIHPYSDFLLHDIGYNGDFIGQGDAGITELRPPPLWGMRVRDPLWHDGRVAGGTFDFRVAMVIDQHSATDGEAFTSSQLYNALPAAGKDALVAFLDSLGKAEFDMDGDGMITPSDQVEVQNCAAGPQGYSPDHPCAVADADQDGDVDAQDLELLDVALGNTVPDDEDEDEDGDAGPGTGDGPGALPIIVTGVTGNPGTKSMKRNQTAETETNSTTDKGAVEIPSPERRPRLDRDKRPASASGRASSR